MLLPQSEAMEAAREVARGLTTQFPRSYFLERARDRGDIPEFWAAMAEKGALGLDVEEEFGGSGRDLCASVAFQEGIAARGVSVASVLATGIVRGAIREAGTDEQKQRLIPPTVSGEKRFAFALTEPEAGTNSFNITTRATRQGDGSYLLNGQKTFISHWDHCQLAMVVAQVKDDEGKDDIGLFVIDLPAEGVVTHRREINMFAPDSRFHVFFDDVVVEPRNRIGEGVSGKRVLFSILNPERFLIAAISLGMGDFALSKGVEYAKVRSPFGTPIGAYQGVSHPLARAKMHLEAARVMTYHGAAMYEAGEDTGASANMAKFLATEAANEALDASIQAHGGSAFDEETDLSTLWPMIRVQRVAPVNDQMVLNFVSERVLGLPRSY